MAIKQLQEMLRSGRTYTIAEIQHNLRFACTNTVYYRAQVSIAELKGNVDADGFDIKQVNENTRVKLMDIVKCKIIEEE